MKKQADVLKKTLDEMRPLFATRNFFDAPSAEDRRAEFARPEPDFILASLAQRVSQMLNGLEGFAAAPSESQLKQIALTKVAIEGGARSMDRLRVEVVKFNDAMNAARIPYIAVP